MNKIFNILVAFTILFAVFSCDKNEVAVDNEIGYLSLIDLSIDDQVEVKSSSVNLIVVIKNSSGKEVASFTNHNNLPEKIKLTAGKYTVEVSSLNIDQEAAFDKPIYFGSKDFTIIAGASSQVSVVAYHGAVLLKVAFSENILNNFSSYNVMVTNELNSLTFNNTTVSRTGYFKVPATKELSYTVNLVNNDGRSFSVDSKLQDLNVRDFITLNIDVEEKGSNDPNTSFRVLVDQIVNEKKTNILLTAKHINPPVIESVNADISAPVYIVLDKATPLTLSASTDNGISSLALNFDRQMFGSLGFPPQIRLLNPTAEESQLMADFGITVNLSVDRLSADVDLTAMTAKLPIVGVGDAFYKFSLVVVDVNKQFLSREITTQVSGVPIAKVSTGSASVSPAFIWPLGFGAVNATLNGSLEFGVLPENISFMYRVQGDLDWIEVNRESVIIDETNKTVTFTGQFKLNKIYEYKAVSDTSEGAVREFVTPWPMIENLNFDSWSQSGKTWYPTASANGFWESGNEGLTYFLVNKPSNTTPDSQFKVGGSYSAKLHSIDGVMAVGFAAGNIFTGTFVMNMSKPIESVQFGRPYTGRPNRLTGYYCYQPKTINIKPELNNSGGTMDMCHIYISLENWGTDQSRPSNPTIIGYGELWNRKNLNAFEEFSIDIKYNYDGSNPTYLSGPELITKNIAHTQLNPTHIVLVATSSYYGEKYCGGTGSTLWIDEFNFEFD